MKSRSALHIIGGFLLAVNCSCTKEENLPEVEVYGHTGTSIYPSRSPFPANSLEAVCYALDVLDADGVEVDVQMTKDSVLVLYHDAYLDDHTELDGCIQDKNYADLKDAGLDGTRYPLIRLADVLEACAERKKSIFIDVKTYNYCEGQDMDYATFNAALGTDIAAYSFQQRSRITVNTRRADLLTFIEDTVITKSFETENFELAIEKVQAGVADELCINYSAFTKAMAENMHAIGIRFSLFGVKTTGEIRKAVELEPAKMITDNIAFTRKVTQ